MSQVTGIECPQCKKGVLRVEAFNKSGQAIESAELNVSMFGEVEFFDYESLIGTENEWASTTAVCTKCDATFVVDPDNAVLYPVSDKNPVAKKYRIGNWIDL